MNRRSTPALITLGSSGAVTYQRFASNDLFAMVRDNEPEATQLLAEGYFDGTMLATGEHPLLCDGDSEASPPRRRRRRRPKRRP